MRIKGPNVSFITMALRKEASLVRSPRLAESGKYEAPSPRLGKRPAQEGKEGQEQSVQG